MIKLFRPFRLVILVALAGVFFTGCKKEETQSGFTPESKFVMYISNQSIATEEVDIKVLIDNSIYIDGNFAVENGTTWQRFEFSIPKGNHEILVESTGANIKMNETIDLSRREHFAVVDYHYDPAANVIPPRYFTFKTYDIPEYGYIDN